MYARMWQLPLCVYSVVYTVHKTGHGTIIGKEGQFFFPAVWIGPLPLANTGKSSTTEWEVAIIDYDSKWRGLFYLFLFRSAANPRPSAVVRRRELNFPILNLPKLSPAFQNWIWPMPPEEYTRSIALTPSQLGGGVRGGRRGAELENLHDSPLLPPPFRYWGKGNSSRRS